MGFWEEVESRPWKELEGTEAAVLPLGSFEQHGPLPLFTDTLVAFEVAKGISRTLNYPLLPPIFYGMSEEHSDFPLTVYVRLNAFLAYLRDIFESLQSHGLRLLVVVNGHGGNLNALKALVSEWNYSQPMKIFLIWPFACVDIKDEWHAGKAEASIVAYLLGKHFTGEGRLCEYMYPYFRTAECSETGSLYRGSFESDPSLGKELLEKMVACSVDKVRDFLRFIQSGGRHER